MADDPDLAKIRTRWEQALRQGIARLPDLRFRPRGKAAAAAAQEETIELVEPNSGAPSESAAEAQAQMTPPPTTPGKSQRSA